MSDDQPLSDYWEAFQIGGADSAAPDSPVDSPVSLRFRPGDRPEAQHRNRAFSDAMVLETFRPALTPFHPASSLPDFIDCFGPLIFPLYRAALLRKRILFMGEAPVHTPCNYGNACLHTAHDSQLTQFQFMISLCWHLCRIHFCNYSQRTAPRHCVRVHFLISASMISLISLPSTLPEHHSIPKRIQAGLPAPQTAC